MNRFVGKTRLPGDAGPSGTSYGMPRTAPGRTGPPGLAWLPPGGEARTGRSQKARVGPGPSPPGDQRARAGLRMLELSAALQPGWGTRSSRWRGISKAFGEP